jgi:CRP-like cAMP-binding protein
MVKQLMPAAQLESREGDLRLTDEEYLKLSLFAQLKRKPSLDKYPGTMVVRRFKKGELIFRQGEAGWTAFYLLTSEDVLALREAQAAANESDKRALQAEIADLRQRVERQKVAPGDEALRRAATVYLAIARTSGEQRRNTIKFLNFNSRRLGAGPVKNADEQTFYIPVDGPVTINYESLKAVLKEGELFGEMSCMYRTPRSATVRADRDCYALEMLRNILDQIQKDPQYKAKSDEIYKKRVFELQLRKLSIFSDLSDTEFNEVREGVDLLTVDPGTLVCDEHDRPDGMYIVRSGMVKVMKNVSALLGADHVVDWTALCAALREGEAKKAEPCGRLWQVLPERVRTIVTGTEAARLNTPDRMEIVGALNDLLKTPGFADHKEFGSLKDKPPLADEGADLLRQHQELVKKKKELPEDELRRLHRLVLEAILPKTIRSLASNRGPETVLSYLSRGDYFGEIGMMMNQPRIASCIAYGHPNDFGQVELVKIPNKVFWKLMKTSTVLRDRVKANIAVRRRQAIERLLTPPWDDTNQVKFSERFEELGLIQGQKLMLIDLDRCTRCDECVRACVATHTDGRTRLFLDGPRFGKYLVPTACRSCLDPVCMIGCPVGSIHRGDNREIVIEDWCIGCGLCADQCPYGSILMHDLGVIPENTRDWRWMPAVLVEGDKWKQLGFKDAGWLVGESPFRFDREMREQLASFKGRAFATQPTGAEQANFRLEFDLRADLLQAAAEFKVETVSQSAGVTVWINGKEVPPDDKPKRGRREYTMAQKPADDSTAKEVPLRLGKNCLAVQVTLSTNTTDVLMQARLDVVRRPELPAEVDAKIAEEVTEKLVTQRAVVCDLCSTMLGQLPACVHACPHDAAMRVDARSEFPMK